MINQVNSDGLTKCNAKEKAKPNEQEPIINE